MMRKTIAITGLFLTLSATAWAQDNNKAVPGTCASGTTAGCTSTDPDANEQTAPSDMDIDTNTGTGTNGTAPTDQPTGASPVNPATNPSGSSGSGAGNGS